MNLKTTISAALLRKSFAITLVLLFSLNFSVGAVLASSCDSWAGCHVCAEAVHSHQPAMDMARAPHGCPPLQQNDACGFETGPGLDQSHGIVPAVRTYQYDAGVIIGTVPIDSNPARTAARFSPQPLYSDTQPTTPIFLTIQSLLC